MGALMAGPGGLWTLLGAGSWGLAAGLVRARAAEERRWWACLVAVPLGLLLLALALIPAFALLAPPVAPAAAALVGLMALGVAWWLDWGRTPRVPGALGPEGARLGIPS